MSLLQKASIITTPTAYAEDYLYSIKPAIPFGEELVVNGNFNTDSDWTKGTGWTISGGKAIGTNATGNLQQSISFTNGRVYKISFQVLDYVSGQVRLQTDQQNSVVVSANGIYTENLTMTTDSLLIFNGIDSNPFNGSMNNVSVKELTDADFDFDRNSTGTRVNEDYLIEDVPYNLLTNSQNFASGYNYTDASYESGFLAPDGTATAFKITKTGSNGHVQQVIANPNTTMKKSIFAKTVSGTGTVNLLNHNSESSALFTITNEWQRFEIDNAGLTSFFYLVDFRSTSGTLTEVLVWGAQLTKGLSKPI